MLLQMNIDVAVGYKSNSQRARVVTEQWTLDNMFCPRCGNNQVSHFENNRPVADFFCPSCNSQYELKSISGAYLNKINDGAYSTMIDRIMSMDSPDFFFMSYLKPKWTVYNLFFVPKHFFTPSIISKRKPLSANARRAGWTGCNILLSEIPQKGRISIVENGNVASKNEIMKRVAVADSLFVADINKRGWLFDVLSCVEKLDDDFTLMEMYSFDGALSKLHPSNNNIRPKIRQQLQMLRDFGIIEFTSRGKYRKVV